MKYILSSFAILALLGGVPEARAASVDAFPVQAYSVDTQSANLAGDANTTSKPKTTKKTTKKKTTKTTKKVTKPKTTKVKASTPKKTVAKKTTKKPKVPKDTLSTTAIGVEDANLDITDQISGIQGNDQNSAQISDNSTVDSLDVNSGSSDSSDDNTLPKPSSDTASKGKMAKGLAIAGSAVASGLGLMFLVRKYFLH